MDQNKPTMYMIYLEKPFKIYGIAPDEEAQITFDALKKVYPYTDFEVDVLLDNVASHQLKRKAAKA